MALLVVQVHNNGFQIHLNSEPAPRPERFQASGVRAPGAFITERIDPATGRIFFGNRATGQTAWARADLLPPAPKIAAAVPAGAVTVAELFDRSLVARLAGIKMTAAGPADATDGATSKAAGLADEEQTIIMVGNPGMGKSTLLNQLCGAAVFQSGEGKGHHGCTTETQWHVLPPAHGRPTLHLCDTPGLKDLSMAAVAAE